MKPPRIDSQGRRLCTGHTTAGKKCRAPAVRGAMVCVNHGGAKGTPGREAADRLILADLLGPALMLLRDVLADEEAPTAVRVTAAKVVLDKLDRADPYAEIPPPEIIARWIAEAEAAEADRLG